MKNFTALLIVGAGLVAAVAGIMAINGFMLSYIWQWFVVPLGAPAIGIVQAIGISILVSMLTWQGPTGKSDDDGKIFVILGAKLVAFGLAYGASFWMPA